MLALLIWDHSDTASPLDRFNMADLIRSKEGALEKTRSRSNHIVEELDPSSGWTEDPNNYYLLIDLPRTEQCSRTSVCSDIFAVTYFLLLCD